MSRPGLLMTPRAFGLLFDDTAACLVYRQQQQVKMTKNIVIRPKRRITKGARVFYLAAAATYQCRAPAFATNSIAVSKDAARKAGVACKREPRFGTMTLEYFSARERAQGVAEHSRRFPRVASPSPTTPQPALFFWHYCHQPKPRRRCRDISFS